MGLGSGEWYESRFLRKCIDGGHAGVGHRRRAVGNQDFLRCVTDRKLASAKRPPFKKGFATKASLPRRRRPSVLICWFNFPAKSLPGARFLTRIRLFPTRIRFDLWPCTKSVRPREAFGFKFFMHFSFYLMIAALVLVGLEVTYALYQLATFVL